MTDHPSNYPACPACKGPIVVRREANTQTDKPETHVECERQGTSPDCACEWPGVVLAGMFTREDDE